MRENNILNHCKYIIEYIICFSFFLLVFIARYWTNRNSEYYEIFRFIKVISNLYYTLQVKFVHDVFVYFEIYCHNKIIIFQKSISQTYSVGFIQMHAIKIWIISRFMSELFFWFWIVYASFPCLNKGDSHPLFITELNHFVFLCLHNGFSYGICMLNYSRKLCLYKVSSYLLLLVWNTSTVGMRCGTLWILTNGKWSILLMIFDI